jgi:hypothetical protein
MKRVIAIAAALAVWGVVTERVAKADTIDFSGGKGGKLQYTAGIGNTVRIGGAPVSCASNAVTGSCSPQSGAFEMITNGLLRLTSGPETGDSGISTNPFSATFGAGGSLQLIGTITSLGIPKNSTLLSGTFDDGSFTVSNYNTLTGTGAFAGHMDITSANPTLLAALGIAGIPTVGSDTQQLIYIRMNVVNGTFTSLVASTVVSATAAPEPMTLALFGVGLLGVAGVVRRRVRERGLRFQLKSSSERLPKGF